MSGCSRAALASAAVLGASLLAAVGSAYLAYYASAVYAPRYRAAAQALQAARQLQEAVNATGLTEAASLYTQLYSSLPELEKAARLYTRLYPVLRGELLPLAEKLARLAESPAYHRLVEALLVLGALDPDAARAAALLQSLPPQLQEALRTLNETLESLNPRTLNETLNLLRGLAARMPPQKLNETLQRLLEAEKALDQANETLAAWPPERLAHLAEAGLAASLAAAAASAAALTRYTRARRDAGGDAQPRTRGASHGG